MNPRTDDNYLTPLYSSVLTVIFDSIAKQLIHADYLAAWDSLKACFVYLPPNVALDVEDKFKEINNALDKLSAVTPEDALFREYEEVESKTIYLKDAVYELSEAIKVSMVENNYLLFESGRPKTRETNAKNFSLDIQKAIYGRKEPTQ